MADDHPILLDALEQVLSLEPDLQVVARCRDGVEVLEAVQKHPADLLLLDIRMPLMDGLAVLRELHALRHELPVMVLTAGLDDEGLGQALVFGVRAVVLKDVAPQLLVACVRNVHAGGRWIDERCLARVSEAFQRESAGRGVSKRLTPRELEVVRKVVAGKRNKAVAKELGVSEGTIKIHLHNIYEKLELENRFALMTWARAHGPLEGRPGDSLTEYHRPSTAV